MKFYRQFKGRAAMEICAVVFQITVAVVLIAGITSGGATYASV